MDFLSEYILKSQPVYGCIRFFVFLICWPSVIVFLNFLLYNDRQEFKCTPKPDDVTLHLCYDNYTSTMSPLLTPLNFSYATASAIGFLWLVIIVHSVKDVPQIKREEDNEKKKHHLNSYWRKFIIHVCMELAVLIVMMVVFCSQTIYFPEKYMCSIGETPFNKVVNITCSDLHNMHKSGLNVCIILIMFVSAILCGVVIGCALKRGKTRLIADLAKLETDSSDGRSSESYSGGNERRELCMECSVIIASLDLIKPGLPPSVAKSIKRS